VCVFFPVRNNTFFPVKHCQVMRACMRLGCHSDSLVVVKASSGTEDELPQGALSVKMGFSHPTWGVQLKKMGHNLGYWDDMGMGQEPLCHYAVHFHHGDHISSWIYTQIISAHDCELVLETEDCS